MPEIGPADPIYRALTSRGLVIPEHATIVGGSSLGGHFHYDQVAVFPGPTQDRVEGIGVFDFDTALFRELWETRPETSFRAYMRYYVSDHRLLWAEFKT